MSRVTCCACAHPFETNCCCTIPQFVNQPNNVNDRFLRSWVWHVRTLGRLFSTSTRSAGPELDESRTSTMLVVSLRLLRLGSWSVFPTRQLSHQQATPRPLLVLDLAVLPQITGFFAASTDRFGRFGRFGEDRFLCCTTHATVCESVSFKCHIPADVESMLNPLCHSLIGKEATLRRAEVVRSQ